MRNYWKDLISEAFEDAKIVATDEQINNVAGWAESGLDNYSQACGSVHTTRGPSDAEIKLNELKREIKKREDWVSSTRPCIDCCTTGWITDSWGQDMQCLACGGEGRVRF